MTGPLVSTRRDAALHLALNRPEVGNSLSADLVCALTEVIQAAADEDIQVVILSGLGRHFCTGFDLSELDRETDDSLLARFVRIELLLQSIRHAPFDTVAIGHGRVMGAGSDLLAACRYRFVVTGTTVCFPGAAFGLVLGSGHLARQVGQARACEWITSGRIVDCHEALQSGLVNKVLEQSDVDPELERWMTRVSAVDGQTRCMVAKAGGPPPGTAERDLYALVCSAARPGIKERIQAYRARVVAGKHSR